MKLSIIGAGRVGQTIGRLAREAGYEIGEVVCRSSRSARAAVKFIGAGAPQGAQKANLSKSDIILISTPDDHINDAVEIILQNAASVGRPVILHTSGALSSLVLSLLASSGFSAASCHPLQTFESPRRALTLIPRTHFCIEGEPRATRAARQLVRLIGAKHFEIPTRMKSLYHAAAVMSSAGIAALLSISLEIFSRAGLSPRAAREILLPLVEGTLTNIHALGPARAMTGPVRRGDAGTVKRNLEALRSFDHRALEIYRLLAERSIQLALSAGADRSKLETVRRALKGK
ncbi:MAG: DUF2520 domain-containing protein [Acidobacteriota bacterium]